MSRVRVVEPGKGSALVLRSLVAPVPRHDRIQPIRVGRGRHQHDYVLEQRAVALLGGEPVRQRHREETRSNLGGVDVVVDEDHGRHRADERILQGRRQAPRIGEQRLGSLDLIQPLLMPRCGDSEEQQGAAEGAVPYRVQPHVTRGVRQPADVAPDLGPVGQHRVGARHEPEHFLGSRYSLLPRQRHRSGEREHEQQVQYGPCAASDGVACHRRRLVSRRAR